MEQRQRGRKSRASLEIVGRQPSTDPPRSVFKPPEPPGDLAPPEAELWITIFQDYAQTTRLATNVLHNGLLSHQLAREAQAAVERDGLVVDGVSGQSKAHPLLSVVRDHRAAWLAAVKVLGLEL
jgi:hypothetical protein